MENNNYKKVNIPELDNVSWLDDKIFNPLYLKYKYKWWYKWTFGLGSEISWFFYRIKHVCKWVPTLWNDYDWDHVYIMIMLQKKLLYTRNRIVKNSIIVEGQLESINRYITICINLIDKINNNDYELEYSDYHKSNDNLLGTLPRTTDKNGMITWNVEYSNERYEDYFNKHKSAYNKVIKEGIVNKFYNNNTSRTQAMALGYFNHQRAKKLLFKILEEKIEEWWD